MFPCLALLMIAIGAGSLWTYVYSPKMPFAARLCAGACGGLALLATFGFISALLLGLDQLTLWLSAAAMALPWLWLKGRYGSQIQRDLVETAGRVRGAVLHPSRTAFGYVAFYSAVALLLGFVFANAMLIRPDGIYTGLLNNLGDLPFHLQVISSFVHGRNFPPEDPFYAGVRFTYPFMADFLTAMLVRAGASLIAAMWMQNVVLAMALVGLMHYWTLELTRDRLAGFIAPVLLLLSGGLGWWLLFRDSCSTGAGIIAFLRHLPHDYTILVDPLFRWGNSLTTLFVPERSILFGMPIAVAIFAQWWLRLAPAPKDEEGREPPLSEEPVAAIKHGEDHAGLAPRVLLHSERRMIAAGVLAGMLPLIHAHAFIVVMGMGGCLALLFPQWRAWLAFFAPALLIAVPEMLWSTYGSGVHPQTFLGWYLGWDRGGANPIWFWFVNTGFFIPLLICAMVWAWKVPGFAPKPLLRFYSPFLLCFIGPNLVKFAPWGWDNIKVLFFWFVASVPLVGLLLSRWIKRRGAWRQWAVLLLVSLTLAGTLDIVRVLTGTEENREFDPDGMAMAADILKHTAPRALILHAPTYNPPVYLTGRRSLLGYPGSVWSRGLDYVPRENDIHRIYAGAPDAISLLQRYQVNYILVSPIERATLTVNEGFWKLFPLVAQDGEYRLYAFKPFQ